jgi:hypothetical protein
MILMLGAWTFLRALLGGSAAVSLENVALRHQLAVLQRSANPFHSLNLAFACAIEFQRHGPCPKQRYGNGPVTAAAFGWRYRSVESFGPEASVSPLAQSGSGVRVADLLP